MRILDILSKPVSQLSDEELEERLNLLRRLKVVKVSEGKKTTEKKRKRKSNITKQLEDLFTNLSDEELKQLESLLKEEQDG